MTQHHCKSNGSSRKFANSLKMCSAPSARERDTATYSDQSVRVNNSAGGVATSYRHQKHSGDFTRVQQHEISIATNLA